VTLDTSTVDHTYLLCRLISFEMMQKVEDLRAIVGILFTMSGSTLFAMSSEKIDELFDALRPLLDRQKASSEQLQKRLKPAEPTRQLPSSPLSSSPRQQHKLQL
jgi:hypothetical protein